MKYRTRFWSSDEGSSTAVQFRTDGRPMVQIHGNLGWMPISNAPTTEKEAEQFAEEVAKKWGLEERSQELAYKFADWPAGGLSSADFWSYVFVDCQTCRDEPEMMHDELRNPPNALYRTKAAAKKAAEADWLDSNTGEGYEPQDKEYNPEEDEDLIKPLEWERESLDTNVDAAFGEEDHPEIAPIDSEEGIFYKVFPFFIVEEAPAISELDEDAAAFDTGEYETHVEQLVSPFFIVEE